ncbi:MAG: adenosylcobinamide-GDP ribazoletransferase [SAR324 cluster bacterium]|nr:adenosylcobinamide-GDP ribazoletransferase [SAR324 cluster bacterium]
MHKEIEPFLAALSFYTRIPVACQFENLAEVQKRSIVYLPLIGWIVGGIEALVFLLGMLLFPHSVALFLSLVSAVMLTGALHEDGFADTCDGFGGGWTAEEVLRIMKDSRIGVYGVSGLILLFGLKFVTLLETDSSLIPVLFIAAHSLSRATAASLLFTHNYVGASSQSKASALVKRLSLRELGLICLFGALPLLLFLNPFYFLLIIPLFLIQKILGLYTKRRIGGYTGDTLGAAQQITETVVYLAFLAASGL